MELCFFITLVCSIGFIFGFFLLVAVCQRPPNTPSGRTFYAVTGLVGFLLTFLLGCYWFPLPVHPRPIWFDVTHYLEGMWRKSPSGCLFLIGLWYLSVGLVVKAGLGRRYREEEEGEG